MKSSPTESKLQSYLDGQNRLLIINLLSQIPKNPCRHNLLCSDTMAISGNRRKTKFIRKR